MAEGFLGNLMSGIFPQNQRDLDEEERRMIEELRAAGAYVPQERPVNYLQYGGGRRRDENLAAMRAAIQPEKKRRIEDIVHTRESSKRQREALEKFNQQQEFARQTAQRNRAKAVADEARRRELQKMPTTTPEERFNKMSNVPFQPGGMGMSREDFIKGATPQITDRQRAELEVLNRAATPALAAQTQLESAQTTLATQQATKELADSVRNALPPNYANLLANKQAISVELENALNQTRLAVAQSPLARQLEESKMDKSLMTLELEKATLKHLKKLYEVNPELRDQLKQLEIQLQEAERDLKRAQADALRGKLQNPFTSNAAAGARAAGIHPTGHEFDTNEAGSWMTPRIP
jgi:hypothetical protein